MSDYDRLTDRQKCELAWHNLVQVLRTRTDEEGWRILAKHLTEASWEVTEHYYPEVRAARERRALEGN